MVIYATEQVSFGCYKISSDSGLAFFIRTDYLKIVSPDRIVADAVFQDEEESDIVDAGLAFACETKAMEYLGRAEQNRFSLTQKLLNKNYQKKHVAMALDYLQGKNYLCDYRFALCWLNSRVINHAEGRIRLESELAARGIGKVDSKKALDDFFSTNDEQQLCLRAINKAFRLGVCADEKLFASLIKKGFCYQMIKKMLPLSDYSLQNQKKGSSFE